MNKQQTTNNKQRGQVIIVVILLLLVMSLIVLAVASRSITDIKISTTSEESARAFSAAEAGVEEAVQKIYSNNVPIGSQQIVLPDNPNAGSYEVTPQGSITNQAFLSPTPLNSDIQTLQVYLADVSDANFGTNQYAGNYAGGNVCLYWGNQGATNKASIEATVIYTGSGNLVREQRFAFDSPPARNNFSTPVGSSSCPTSIAAADNNLGIRRDFAYSTILNLTPGVGNLSDMISCGSVRCLHSLRLRLLNTSNEAQYIGVAPQSGRSLPSQGYRISSTGQAGQTNRKVDVFQSHKAVPAILDFVLYSGASINK